MKERLLDRFATGSIVAVLIGACAGAGYALGVGVAPAVSNRMFPWILARATGIGAFVALTGVVLVGAVFRRPVRAATALHRETVLRFHIFLWPALAGLLAAHIGSLLADRYAGVPWKSLVLPGAATYRPGAVTYGLIALYLLVLVTASALLAGRALVRWRWAWIHRLSYVAFALAWVHGVLAGSDTPALRALYILAGAAVVGAAVWATFRRPLRPDLPSAAPGPALPQVAAGPGRHGDPTLPPADRVRAGR